MKVLITGGTGFVGSRVVQKLAARGHELIATVRSEESATRLPQCVHETVVVPLADTETLQRLAARYDGVVHLGFEHGPDLARAVEQDRKVIAAFVAALERTGKPLVASSATGIIGDTGGVLVDEDHASPSNYPPAVRRLPEADILAAGKRGVRASAIRVANLVHNSFGGGPISRLLNLARRTGVSHYVGTGANHLPCVHLDDLADLYVLALERAPEGRIYNGNGADIAMRDVASAIATSAGVRIESISPEQALSHFGKFAGLIFSLDIRASNQRARNELGWQPYQATPDLIKDVSELPEAAWINAAGLRH